MAQILGEAVTPEVAAAWEEVYWLFALQLVAEEARLYQHAGVDPAQPTRPYRIVKTIDETSDIISLVLEPADDLPLPEILPGQYVSVFVNLPDGDRQPRQYTVSSTAVGTRLQITVRRVFGRNGAPNGRVSTYLHDQAKVGDILDVSAPAGDFVVTPSDSPLLLASAGSGITTVLPIVEHIVRTQPRREVIVAHADRTAQDHALRQTVERMGHQLDNFISYTWYEHVDPGGTTSRQGHMDLSDIPLPDNVHVFTCGPLGFMRHIRTELMQRSVPAHHIRYEVFGPDLWAPRRIEFVSAVARIGRGPAIAVSRYPQTKGRTTPGYSPNDEGSGTRLGSRFRIRRSYAPGLSTASSIRIRRGRWRNGWTLPVRSPSNRTCDLRLRQQRSDQPARSLDVGNREVRHETHVTWLGVRFIFRASHGSLKILVDLGSVGRRASFPAYADRCRHRLVRVPGRIKLAEQLRISPAVVLHPAS